MKKRSIKQPPTKKSRKSEIITLKEYMDQRFATKEDLRREIAALEARTYIKFDAFFLKIDDNARKYRDDVLRRFDDFAAKFEKLQIDRTVGADQTHKLQKRVDDHERRLTKIEKIQATA